MSDEGSRDSDLAPTEDDDYVKLRSSAAGTELLDIATIKSNKKPSTMVCYICYK